MYTLATQDHGGKFKSNERLIEARHFIVNGLPAAQNKAPVYVQGDSPSARKARSLAACAVIMGA